LNSLIIETTLIGTGGGYGESVVLHLGNQNWIVVDSCIDPYTKNSLPLEYLKEKGVDLKNDVKLIVCTHWHDDHISGISKLVEECENAIFSSSMSSDKTKFLQLVGLDYNKIKGDSTISSTKEFKTCLRIIGERKSTFRSAVQDKSLLGFNDRVIKSKVIALSPSDYIINEFNKEISTLISEFGPSNKKITYQSPNDKSVVLYIKVNEHSILLGSDLEVTSDARRGWFCILNENQSIDAKASVFKIPHHGSETGYHEKIWDELVENNAIAKLSPYNRGTKLPKDEMLEKFKIHTENLYLTSIINSKPKAKKREKSIEKAIEKFNKTVSEVRYNKGIVRCFIDLSDGENAIWQVELINSAKKI